jgi:hypothetical protein
MLLKENFTTGIFNDTELHQLCLFWIKDCFEKLKEKSHAL